MSELHVRNIVNDIQVLHQLELSGRAWEKVREGVKGAIQVDRETLMFERDMYKKAYENMVNTAFLLNELKLCIRTNTKATRADILQMMLQQEMDGMNARLRDIRIV